MLGCFSGVCLCPKQPYPPLGDGLCTARTELRNRVVFSFSRPKSRMRAARCALRPATSGWKAHRCILILCFDVRHSSRGIARGCGSNRADTPFAFRLGRIEQIKRMQTAGATPGPRPATGNIKDAFVRSLGRNAVGHCTGGQLRSQRKKNS